SILTHCTVLARRRRIPHGRRGRWLGKEVMKRREFISLLGGAAVVWPVGAHAQQGERVRRIGVLVPSFAQTDREVQARVAAFLESLRKLGWVEGRNFQITYRFAAGEPDRLKDAAEELVRSTPDVVVAVANGALA